MNSSTAPVRYISIFTLKGLVQPFQMRGSAFDHEVIATSLSNQCRYLGHIPRFYSIAQHSCHVHDILPPEFKFPGLMHDAPETYLGDVVTPLKRSLFFRLLREDASPLCGASVDYRTLSFNEAEQDLWERLAPVYGLPRELPDIVKAADWYVFNVEVRDLIGTDVTEWGLRWGDPPMPRAAKLKIRSSWSPKKARAEWLKRFALYR